MTTVLETSTDNELENKPTCRVIRRGDTYAGKQGFEYFAGISAESAGARGICMHLLEIPPGGRAKAHLHENHETAIYVLSGTSEVYFGDELEQFATVSVGEFFYIPAGVPHLPRNVSDAMCVAVIARTDPNEQESVVLLPHLEDRVP